jgi:hypothetical protein
MKGEMICATQSNTPISNGRQEILACSMAAGTSPASPRVQSPSSSKRETTKAPTPARASLMDCSASTGAKYAATVCGFAIATS